MIRMLPYLIAVAILSVVSDAGAQTPAPPSQSDTVAKAVAGTQQSNVSIGLAARGKRFGDAITFELTWSGASGATVDLYRNGVKIANTANDGSYRDVVTISGTGMTTYKVCIKGSTTMCSNAVGVSY